MTLHELEQETRRTREAAAREAEEAAAALEAARETFLQTRVRPECVRLICESNPGLEAADVEAHIATINGDWTRGPGAEGQDLYSCIVQLQTGEDHASVWVDFIINAPDVTLRDGYQWPYRSDNAYQKTLGDALIAAHERAKKIAEQNTEYARSEAKEETHTAKAKDEAAELADLLRGDAVLLHAVKLLRAVTEERAIAADAVGELKNAIDNVQAEGAGTAQRMRDDLVRADRRMSEQQDKLYRLEAKTRRRNIKS